LLRLIRALLLLACNLLKESGYAMTVPTTKAGTRAERFYCMMGGSRPGRKEDGQIIFQKSI
jgi:hypothetical protein